MPVPPLQQLPVLSPQSQGVGLAAGIDPLPAEKLGASGRAQQQAVCSGQVEAVGVLVWALLIF